MSPSDPVREAVKNAKETRDNVSQVHSLYDRSWPSEREASAHDGFFVSSSRPWRLGGLPLRPAPKIISKKSAEFQKHVQFFHLPAIDVEDVVFLALLSTVYCSTFSRSAERRPPGEKS